MTDTPDWTKALEVASDIDAILHAGQRAEPRYSKIAPVIVQALRDERERCAKVAEEFPTADTYDLARGRHEIAAAIRGRQVK